MHIWDVHRFRHGPAPLFFRRGVWVVAGSKLIHDSSSTEDAAEDATTVHEVIGGTCHTCHLLICEPWCWNIYQHLPHKSPSFVGK